MSAAVAILRRLPSTVEPSSLAEAGGCEASCFCTCLASSSRALRASLSSFLSSLSNSLCF